MPKGKGRPQPPGSRVRTDMMDFYGVNSLAEVNKSRKAMGLPPVRPKKRNCLRCDAEFLSQDAGHRMCTLCRTNTRTDVDVD